MFSYWLRVKLFCHMNWPFTVAAKHFQLVKVKEIQSSSLWQWIQELEPETYNCKTYGENNIYIYLFFFALSQVNCAFNSVSDIPSWRTTVHGRTNMTKWQFCLHCLNGKAVNIQFDAKWKKLQRCGGGSWCLMYKPVKLPSTQSLCICVY